MVRVSATPQPHSVFNQFDRHGLVLGLPRLTSEKNAEYKQRLMDVFVNRASSTYRGLINGITRELGLNIIDTMNITPVKDGNGDPLLPNPAVEFIDTRCKLYRDYMEDDILLDIDRYTPTAGSWTLAELVTTINNTGYFTASLTSEAEGQKRSMTIFNQSTIVHIPAEEISGAGSTIVLKNQNLIEGSVTVRSQNLVRRVYTEAALVGRGTYMTRHKEGILLTRGAPAPGSFIRYSYRDDEFVAQSSPVIIHNLQSTNFRNIMFENSGGDETDNYGLPTKLGAEIINELMSIFPANFGA